MATGIGQVLRDEDYAEVRTDGEGAWEEGQDYVGMSAGGDVEIFGREVEEEIADAASGEVRFMAGGAKLEDDAFGGELGG
jgi:hypothetical protein